MPLTVVPGILPMHLPPKSTSESRCWVSAVLPTAHPSLKSHFPSTLLTQSSRPFGICRSISHILTHVSQHAPHSPLLTVFTCWCPTHHVGVLEKLQQPLFLPSFAGSLLKGQQPPARGPGTAGSATYHVLCVQQVVCRWPCQGAGRKPWGRRTWRRGATAADAANICMWSPCAQAWLPHHDQQLEIRTRPSSGDPHKALNWMSLGSTVSHSGRVSKPWRRERQWSWPFKSPGEAGISPCHRPSWGILYWEWETTKRRNIEGLSKEDATSTKKVYTIRPRNVGGPSGPRSAPSAKASVTWWPGIHRRAHRPPAHRESQPTLGRKKRSTAQPCS